MGRIEIVGRRGVGRCAFCHDTFASGAMQTCAGCGAGLHAACREELKGCPTLGCAESGPRAKARQEAPPQQRPPREYGRITRDPPGSFGRLGPYARMGVRTAFHLFTTSVLILAVLYIVTHFSQAWRFFTGEAALVKSGVAIVLAGGFGYCAYDWLHRLPTFWSRVSELLDDGQVTPMHFSVVKHGSGKNTTITIHLRDNETGLRRKIKVDGVLPPIWLRWRGDQIVYVHGRRDDEPCVIEFEDGTLALLDPA